jgi:hypothetical protein
MEKIAAPSQYPEGPRISMRLFFPIILFLTVFLSHPVLGQVAPETGPSSILVRILESESFRMELAYKYIGDQIEAKLEKERNASALDPLWQAAFWRYIPFVPAGPPKIVEDTFLTPNYLSFPHRRLDTGLVLSEKRGIWEIRVEAAERKR